MTERLKKIIFDKLYQDLKHVEIIDYDDSIWFIDRERRYWYLEYQKKGTLWWRYDFFSKFFALFSLKRGEFETIMGEWVEEVLNYKVETSYLCYLHNPSWLEEALYYKVKTTNLAGDVVNGEMEEVLNYKVKTTEQDWSAQLTIVGEVMTEGLKIQLNNE